MCAALPIRFAVTRSGAPEGQGSGKHGKSHSAPKKPPTERRQVAERVSGRSTLVAADIAAAVAWRLSAIPAGDVEALAAILRPLAADGLREEDPGVAAVLADLHYPGDRRGAWSLACACLADDAERRGDQALFWSAGFEVVRALQQGLRGSHSNRRTAPAPDALDELISVEIAQKSYTENATSVDGEAIFAYFADMAGHLHEVLVEFDHGKDELVCQLDPTDKALTNVGRGEFARRVRRAHARHATGCMLGR